MVHPPPTVGTLHITPDYDVLDRFSYSYLICHRGPGVIVLIDFRAHLDSMCCGEVLAAQQQIMELPNT